MNTMKLDMEEDLMSDLIDPLAGIGWPGDTHFDPDAEQIKLTNEELRAVLSAMRSPDDQGTQSILQALGSDEMNRLVMTLNHVSVAESLAHQFNTGSTEEAVRSSTLHMMQLAYLLMTNYRYERALEDRTAAWWAESDACYEAEREARGEPPPWVFERGQERLEFANTVDSKSFAVCSRVMQYADGTRLMSLPPTTADTKVIAFAKALPAPPQPPAFECAHARLVLTEITDPERFWLCLRVVLYGDGTSLMALPATMADAEVIAFAQALPKVPPPPSPTRAEMRSYEQVAILRGDREPWSYLANRDRTL